MEFTILTGMSGSGKTKAIQIFEDLGYFCIDNMPPALIPMLDDVLGAVKGKFSNIALVIDVRVGDMINELLDRVNELSKEYNCNLVFLDADDNTLVKRYKETRRTHPLNDDNGLLSSIKKERELLSELKSSADVVIDTSSFAQEDLRDYLLDVFSKDAKIRFGIKVVSFGFKNGIPVDADMVYDARCFPNPFYVPELKNKTGNDKAVQDYVMNSSLAKEFLGKICDMTEFLIPVFEAEGRYSLIIAIGCTGGHHRSVTFANKLTQYLTDKGYDAISTHRDIKI